MGLALMDENFSYSKIPNKHILYHVKHSVIKQRVSYEFPTWEKK